MVVLKHKYWYMDIPGFGVTAVPADLYTPRDLKISKVLNVLSVSKSLHSVFSICRLLMQQSRFGSKYLSMPRKGCTGTT